MDEKIFQQLCAILHTEGWTKPASGKNFKPSDKLGSLLPNLDIQFATLCTKVKNRFQVEIPKNHTEDELKKITLKQLAELISQQLGREEKQT